MTERIATCLEVETGSVSEEDRSLLAEFVSELFAELMPTMAPAACSATLESIAVR